MFCLAAVDRHKHSLYTKSMVVDDAHVLEQRTGLRSKVECATECYADYRCRTAVYEHDGDCFLVANFTENLSLREHNSNSGYGDYVLEMKTKTQMSTSSGTSEVVSCNETFIHPLSL